VTDETNQTKRKGNLTFPSLFDLVRFVFFAGLTVLVAWVATTGRVGYTMIMLIVAAALAFAVLDLTSYEIVRRTRDRR
jgi:hypothetical protein